MARILNIETATRTCSVALAIDGVVVAMKESNDKHSHAEQITLFCEEVIKAGNIKLSNLDAVAVSQGPGSYTGLRIGVSTAKGFCYASDIPLIAISTLKAMAFGIIEKFSSSIDSGTLICPMIDARRMEVYTSVFTSKLEEVLPIEAKIIDENSFGDILGNNKVIFAGDGAPKCHEALSGNKNAVLINDFEPSAAFMAHMSEQSYRNTDFVNTAYFEPFYLKDFIAGIPKVKGLI